jgi:type I restriction enzyme, R subunit
MVSQTNEQALENCIERSLLEGSRYEKGNPADFDREFAIDREKFWRFLEITQPEELDKLKDRPNWQRLILERLDRQQFQIQKIMRYFGLMNQENHQE